MKARILFISYDGLTDPLGQSQIIPYLAGLSNIGYEIHVLSTEKTSNFDKRKKLIESILSKNNITWHLINYTKKPPIISTLIDIYKLKQKTKKLHKKHNFSIIHCRSYISAFVGLSMRRKHGVRFIFDMRGFFADERIDGNIWDKENFIFKKVYEFFKEKEKDFIQNADYTISLTKSAKEIIRSWSYYKEEKNPIEVIPCCADLNTFSDNNINQSLILKLKTKNNLTDLNYILSYVGSLGTWYMIDEMLDFFKYLLQQKTNAKFLFITNDNKSIITDIANKKNIPTKNLIFYSAERNEVPSLISISNASIFFIKPTFSKKASSPTKMAEILAMGVPIICNAEVGDVDQVIKQENVGIVINKLNKENYIEAIEKIDQLNDLQAKQLRKVSEEYFSLKSGVKLYDSVYQKLL